jgi:hypothetical protein
MVLSNSGPISLRNISFEFAGGTGDVKLSNYLKGGALVFAPSNTQIPSASSQSLSISMFRGAGTESPANLRVTSSTSSSISISWDATPTATSYIVTEATTLPIPVSVPTTSYTFLNLMVNQSLSIYVQSVNSNGILSIPASNPYTTIVKNVYSTTVSGSNVTIKWSAVLNATSYTIYMKTGAAIDGTGGTIVGTYTTAAPNVSYTIPINVGVLYSYVIVATISPSGSSTINGIVSPAPYHPRTPCDGGTMSPSSCDMVWSGYQVTSSLSNIIYAFDSSIDNHIYSLAFSGSTPVQASPSIRMPVFNDGTKIIPAHWVTITYTRPMKCYKYRMASQTRFSDGQPKDFALYGSKDNGVTYVLLHSMINETKIGVNEGGAPLGTGWRFYYVDPSMSEMLFTHLTFVVKAIFNNYSYISVADLLLYEQV